MWNGIDAEYSSLWNSWWYQFIIKRSFIKKTQDMKLWKMLSLKETSTYEYTSTLPHEKIGLWLLPITSVDVENFLLLSWLRISPFMGWNMAKTYFLVNTPQQLYQMPFTSRFKIREWNMCLAIFTGYFYEVGSFQK